MKRSDEFAGGAAQKADTDRDARKALIDALRQAVKRAAKEAGADSDLADGDLSAEDAAQGNAPMSRKDAADLSDKFREMLPEKCNFMLAIDVGNALLLNGRSSLHFTGEVAMAVMNRLPEKERRVIAQIVTTGHRPPVSGAESAYPVWESVQSVFLVVIAAFAGYVVGALN